MRFDDALQETKIILKIKDKEIAEFAGVSRQWINFYRNGRANIKRPAKTALAVTLGNRLSDKIDEYEQDIARLKRLKDELMSAAMKDD
jgi:transcriptional regulator with XRE-family HTH domain